MKYINIDPFLPHRAPILLIDQWASVSNQEVVTLFTIPSDCIFVANQFFQECGLIEHAAQTCSTIVGESFFMNYNNLEDAKPVIGFISMIKKVCIHQLPKIQQTLMTKAQLLSIRYGRSLSLCCPMRNLL